MAGVVAIVIALLLIPVIVLVSMGFVAAVLGWALNEDVNQTHAGSELLETNY